MSGTRFSCPAPGSHPSVSIGCRHGYLRYADRDGAVVSPLGDLYLNAHDFRLSFDPRDRPDFVDFLIGQVMLTERNGLGQNVTER